MKDVKRAAVLGSGVMGASIAAHLANAGIDVLLLDIVPKDAGDTPAERSRISIEAVKNLARIKPAALYLPGYAKRITPGNFEDDAEKLKECDWVVEAIIENMAIKKELFSSKIAPNLGPETVLSTNTSGLSVNEMADALPKDVQSRFLVTHFFNPPRYMRLLEIVPAKTTDQKVVDDMAEFLSRRLGKGIVHAKDTPNFIANRIGVYAIFNAMRHMEKMDLTVEAVDAVAGPATARPKSAAFRTADLVGLDTLVHVANNSFELLPDDDERDMFAIPSYLDDLVKAGKLGNKTKGGFFRREKGPDGSTIFFWDWKTGDYKPAEKPKFPSITGAKQIDDPGERVKAVVNGNDEAASFAWANLRDTLLYALKRIPEIADDVVAVDNAMKWGFNWEIGPFEMMDAIGVPAFTERAKADGVSVPDELEGVERFYVIEDNERRFWDFATKSYKPVPVDDAQIDLTILKKAGAVVEKTAGSSLVDLGDGVFLFEFHSKMNSIGGDILSMATKAVARAEADGRALVVGNQGTNFSVGANLMLIATALAEGAFDEIDMMVRSFQKATMALKYAKVPVIAAPFGMTLGGGCEFAMASHARVFFAETYMGLVEVGVGLLPAGGGTKEFAIRAHDIAAMADAEVSPFLFHMFKNIGMAKISMSADELQSMGYMLSGDRVTLDISRQIHAAKNLAMSMSDTFRPLSPRTDIPVAGRSVRGSIESQLWNMQQGGFISEHDAKIGRAVATVLTGGDVPAGTLVNEQYYLDLEREGFLKLCGEKKTGMRIQHMLKKGKPLRN